MTCTKQQMNTYRICSFHLISHKIIGKNEIFHYEVGTLDYKLNCISFNSRETLEECTNGIEMHGPIKEHLRSFTVEITHIVKFSMTNLSILQLIPPVSMYMMFGNRPKKNLLN